MDGWMDGWTYLEG